MYWPEFGAAGKETITIRQLLSHQAGLPAVRKRLPVGAMPDWTAMTGALARQEPGGNRERDTAIMSTRSGTWPAS